MPNSIRVPTETERLALLDLLKYAILDLKNHAMEMTKEQIFHLMDAVDNIPSYLQTYEEHYWETIMWELNNFDEKKHDLMLCHHMFDLYTKLKLKHEKDTSDRPLSTGH